MIILKTLALVADAGYGVGLRIEKGQRRRVKVNAGCAASRAQPE